MATKPRGDWAGHVISGTSAQIIGPATGPDFSAKAMGMKFVRIEFFWSGRNRPVAGTSTDYAHLAFNGGGGGTDYEQLFHDAFSNGISVVVNIDGSPPWARPDDNPGGRGPYWTMPRQTGITISGTPCYPTATVVDGFTAHADFVYQFAKYFAVDNTEASNPGKGTADLLHAAGGPQLIIEGWNEVNGTAFNNNPGATHQSRMLDWCHLQLMDMIALYGAAEWTAANGNGQPSGQNGELGAGDHTIFQRADGSRMVEYVGAGFTMVGTRDSSATNWGYVASGSPIDGSPAVWLNGWYLYLSNDTAVTAAKGGFSHQNIINTSIRPRIPFIGLHPYAHHAEFAGSPLAFRPSPLKYDFDDSLRRYYMVLASWGEGDKVAMGGASGYLPDGTAITTGDNLVIHYGLFPGAGVDTKRKFIFTEWGCPTGEWATMNEKLALNAFQQDWREFTDPNKWQPAAKALMAYRAKDTDTWGMSSADKASAAGNFEGNFGWAYDCGHIKGNGAHAEVDSLKVNAISGTSPKTLTLATGLKTGAWPGDVFTIGAGSITLTAKSLKGDTTIVGTVTGTIAVGATGTRSNIAPGSAVTGISDYVTEMNTILGELVTVYGTGGGGGGGQTKGERAGFSFSQATSYDLIAADWAAQLVKIGASGTTKVRLPVPWNLIEAKVGSTKTQTWTKLDGLVSDLLGIGIDVTLVVKGTPAYAREAGTVGQPSEEDYAPLSANDLRDFCVLVATRYNEAVGINAPKGIDAIEVWDYPNWIQGLRGTLAQPNPTPELYADLALPTIEAIQQYKRTVASALRVTLGTIASVGGDPAGVDTTPATNGARYSAVTFLTRFYNRVTASWSSVASVDKWNFVGWAPWSGSMAPADTPGNPFNDTTPLIWASMKAHGDGAKFIRGVYGVPTDGPPTGVLFPFQSVDELTQKGRLKPAVDGWRGLFIDAGRVYTDVLFWHELRDVLSTADPTLGAENHYGLSYSDLTPKCAGAKAGVTSSQACPIPASFVTYKNVLAETDAANAGIGAVLAGRSDGGSQVFGSLSTTPKASAKLAGRSDGKANAWLAYHSSASAADTFVSGAKNATTPTTGATHVAVTRPAMVDHDRVILAVGLRSATAGGNQATSVTPPTGFSILGSQATATPGMTVWVMEKKDVTVASEPATYDVAWTGSMNAAICCLVVRGAPNSGTTEVSLQNNASSTALAAAAVTMDLGLGVLGWIGFGAASGSVTLPVGFTDAVTGSTASGGSTQNVKVAAGYKENVATGSQPAASGSMPSASTSVGVQVALPGAGVTAAPLAGQTDGKASNWASLTTTPKTSAKLAGKTAGKSSASANLRPGAAKLVGRTDGFSTARATFSFGTPLAGSTAGASTVSADLHHKPALKGRSDGVSTVLGTLFSLVPPADPADRDVVFVLGAKTDVVVTYNGSTDAVAQFGASSEVRRLEVAGASIKEDDTAANMRVQLIADGSPANLTGWTVAFRMGRTAPGTLVLSAGCTLIDATAGIVEVPGTNFANLTPGDYVAEFVATRTSDGRPRTYPSWGYFDVAIARKVT